MAHEDWPDWPDRHEQETQEIRPRVPVESNRVQEIRNMAKARRGEGDILVFALLEVVAAVDRLTAAVTQRPKE